MTHRLADAAFSSWGTRLYTRESIGPAGVAADIHGVLQFGDFRRNERNIVEGTQANFGCREIPSNFHSGVPINVAGEKVDNAVDGETEDVVPGKSGILLGMNDAVRDFDGEFPRFRFTR